MPIEYLSVPVQTTLWLVTLFVAAFAIAMVYQAWSLGMIP